MCLESWAKLSVGHWSKEGMFKFVFVPPVLILDYFSGHFFENNQRLLTSSSCFSFFFSFLSNTKLSQRGSEEQSTMVGVSASAQNKEAVQVFEATWSANHYNSQPSLSLFFSCRHRGRHSAYRAIAITSGPCRWSHNESPRRSLSLSILFQDQQKVIEMFMLRSRRLIRLKGSRVMSSLLRLLST